MNEIIETNGNVFEQSNWVNRLFASLQEHDYEQFSDSVLEANNQIEQKSCLDVTQVCFF
jgi:hypothetical protein